MYILIDAAFDCYRAHHAFKAFSNSKGQKTGVLFGFLRAINSYRKKFKGQVIVAWEGRPKTRHEASEDYKSDREGLPSDVKLQIPLLRDMLRAMGVLQVQHDDWEADDVLATLAVRLHQTGDDVVIVTGDDDLLQVVRDGEKSIMVFSPRAKVLFHEADVVEKYGVDPKDLLALWAIQGDPSDNIQGVKGVGEGFAVEMVTKYGSDVLRDLGTFVPSTPGIAKKVAAILENKSLVEKNLELLKLNDQVQDMTYDEPVRDPQKLENLFKEAELRSFLMNFGEWSQFNG